MKTNLHLHPNMQAVLNLIRMKPRSIHELCTELQMSDKEKYTRIRDTVQRLEKRGLVHAEGLLLLPSEGTTADGMPGGIYAKATPIEARVSQPSPNIQAEESGSESDPDFEDDDDDYFEPCADCDLPDACADFGCAIKMGIRHLNW